MIDTPENATPPDEPSELDIESSMTEFIESLETSEDDAHPWFIPDSQRAKAGAE